MTKVTETSPVRGRPRKTNIEAKKKGNRGVRGRPPGDAARINEFKWGRTFSSKCHYHWCRW